MEKSRIELALVFNALNIPIELSTFSQRFNVQKTIYLAQVCGMDLGYRFSWYLRGPYCSSLTKDAFTLQEEIQQGDKEHKAYALSEKAIADLERAKTLSELPDAFEGSADDWLELLASLHYLRHIAYRPQGSKRDFVDSFEVLVQSKPHFKHKNHQAKFAWDRLDQLGLLAAKTLT